MAKGIVLSTAGALLCTALGYFAHAFYTHRRKINELRKQGVPMPEGWSWVFGHLLVLQKYVDKIPPDAAVAWAMRDLCQEFADTEVFLMDIWPVYPALYTLFGPTATSQVCNKHNLPKGATLANAMNPVTGGPSMITMNGEEWKFWRSLFNPGFSTGAMLNNVPHIVDSMLIFHHKLAEQVGKGIFSLDDLATKLTMEVILKVTLDDDSNYQRSPHILPTALGRILDWHSFWDPRVLMNPLRPIVQWYNGRLINNYLRKALDNRFQETKNAMRSDAVDEKPKSIKSVTSLALETYLASDRGIQRDVLDEGFAQYAASQIRLFLFAGTDTTASTLVYTYHLLAKHPAWREKLRREHDEVFGRDPTRAADQLKANPSLLNACPLTLAVIKETLRLYTPAGTMRAPSPSGTPGGATITDLRGATHPVDGIAGANVLHHALHLNPRVWARADEFLPDRFLAAPGHPLHQPDPAAFRPFEQGPRNCIGQTLVLNELRVALVLTCRDFDVRDAYAEFDAQRERNLGVWARGKRRVFGEPVRTVHGDRAYQTDSGGLHPVDGYPCYVSWAKDGGA
ncbi:cytochrome P450 [Xylariomycetidae sp. FL0641]|nr:cytochrome P450 [Xylariomycetidae sp. FL0641]